MEVLDMDQHVQFLRGAFAVLRDQRPEASPSKLDAQVAFAFAGLTRGAERLKRAHAREVSEKCAHDEQHRAISSAMADLERVAGKRIEHVQWLADDGSSRVGGVSAAHVESSAQGEFGRGNTLCRAP